MAALEVPLANPIGSPKHVSTPITITGFRYGRSISNTRCMLPAASPPVTWRS